MLEVILGEGEPPKREILRRSNEPRLRPEEDWLGSSSCTLLRLDAKETRGEANEVRGEVL